MNRSKILLFIGLSLSLVGCKVFLPAELRQLEGLQIFAVSDAGDYFVLDGVINSSSFKEFIKLSQLHPNINTIKIAHCGGSINDNVNLQLASYVHEKGFDIHLLDNAEIASGGVDFFLAGIKRTCGGNTKIGVHSWGTDQEKATDFPKGHKYHLPYIKYYTNVGFTQKQAEDFYYFTIYAASPDGIHWMTEQEIVKYNMLSN